jgi:hypothetical protein
MTSGIRRREILQLIGVVASVGAVIGMDKVVMPGSTDDPVRRMFLGKTDKGEWIFDPKLDGANKVLTGDCSFVSLVKDPVLLPRSDGMEGLAFKVLAVFYDQKTCEIITSGMGGLKNAANEDIRTAAFNLEVARNVLRQNPEVVYDLQDLVTFTKAACRPNNNAKPYLKNRTVRRLDA